MWSARSIPSSAARVRGCAGKTTGSSRLVERVDDPAEPRLHDVRLAVDGGDEVPVGLEAEPLENRRALARDRGQPDRGVGHDVADNLDPSLHTLLLELPRRPLVGAEQERGGPVDLDADVLFGHRPVAASHARLDVGEGNAGLDRGRARRRASRRCRRRRASSRVARPRSRRGSPAASRRPFPGAGGRRRRGCTPAPASSSSSKKTCDSSGS